MVVSGVGQSVTFSVDAYPDNAFVGHISQIRKSPHTKESVVTYTVVAAANNDDLLLFPGMTAKADIITRDTPDALQVPSAALRYQPQGVPQPSGSHVWVPAGDTIRPVAVRVGVSNEGMTEIVGGNLSEGETIVVGDAADQTGGSPTIVSRLAGWIKPLHTALAGLANR